MTRLRLLPIVALVAALVHATPASAGHATTEITDVRGISLASGGKTMVTYEVSHDINAHVDPFTALPGARVPSSAAFDGMWGDGAFFGAWLAPEGPFRYQFEPTSWMVESTYFTNWLRQAPEAAPLESGDRFELAMGNAAWYAPLPPRPRGDTGGTLGWDSAVDSRLVTAKFGEDEAEMDAMFFRADVVARGGDVDARRGEVQLPPLVIDLPRSYPGQVLGTYFVSAYAPYTRYVGGMTMRVFPSAGKAVLTTTARGYIHEARERTLPGGADIKEWHLPLTGVIMLSSADDPAAPVGTMGLPAGGEAIVGDLSTERRVSIGPGQTLTVGPGLMTSLEGGAGHGDGAGEHVTAGGDPDQMAEIEAADMVDHSLAAPVDLVQGNGKFALTVDPDFRGEGVLTLRSLRRGEGTTFVDAFAVPYAVVDGETVKLDRSRLIDLRVSPRYRHLTVGFTGTGGSGPLNKTRTFWSSTFHPGLVVDAVYDLGGERYLFLNLIGAPDPNQSPSVVARVQTISFDLGTVQARPVYHLELPAGQVVYDGETRATSFQAPLDLLGDHQSISVGDRRLTSSVIRTGYEGRVTVLPAPAALTPDPSPEPGAPLDGPIALLYAHPETYPGSWNRSSVARVTITSEAEPVANPKPIGTPCGAPQAVDPPAIDAPPALDIVEAWFDADEANLYATLRLRGAPASPPSGGSYRWSVHWGYANHYWSARANLASDGTWTFDHGGYNQGFYKTTDAGGENVSDLIRIRVPRAFLDYADGETLLDTGAHSWVTTPPLPFAPQGITTRPDSAPQDADPTWGTGGSYVMGEC